MSYEMITTPDYDLLDPKPLPYPLPMLTSNIYFEKSGAYGPNNLVLTGVGRAAAYFISYGTAANNYTGSGKVIVVSENYGDLVGYLDNGSGGIIDRYTAKSTQTVNGKTFYAFSYNVGVGCNPNTSAGTHNREQLPLLTQEASPYYTTAYVLATYEGEESKTVQIPVMWNHYGKQYSAAFDIKVTK